jgi:hypothetical protein
VQMALTANDDQSEPKPCERHAKRMLLNAKFVAHLPACGACMKVVAQLNRESEMEVCNFVISRAIPEANGASV